MLSRLLGNVILRPEKDGLWAEMRGDLRVLLEAASNVTSVGAGSPSPALSSWPLVAAAVA